MDVGVIDLQGSVEEHYNSICELIGEDNVFRINKKGLISDMDKLIIPGGESTTVGRLLEATGISDEVIEASKQGKTIYGTCAGLITLAKEVKKRVRETNQYLLELMNIKVERNAFGRQRESFEAQVDLSFLDNSFPGIFIRAPVIVEAGEDVEVLGSYMNKIIAARQENLLVTSFHPELVEDNRVYEFFLGM